MHAKPAPRGATEPNAWGDSGAAEQPPRPGRRRFLWFATCGGVAATGVGGLSLFSPRRPTMRGVLPGEFEPYDLLLLAWDEKCPPAQQQSLKEIAAATRGAVDVLVVTPHDEVQNKARQAMSDAAGPFPHVRFVNLPIDLPWIRDFGPLQIKSFDGEHLIVDTIFFDRPTKLEHTPAGLAALLQMDVVAAPIILQGGNLLSNGAGLCVTTNRTVYENYQKLGYGQRRVENLIREYFGAEQLVCLTSPVGEGNEHIDMFATFVRCDTILVGAYDPKFDAQNAAILDENARRLAEVKTACGPLKVRRIPMPPRPADDQWWTYTNAVYANRVLLFPTYPRVHPQLEAHARRVYQELLPKWRIVGIDAAELMRDQGGLHCATAQLYRSSRPTST